MSPRTIAAGLAILAVSLAGCAPPPEKGPGWEVCVNQPVGYSVAYPAGWKTNEGSVLPRCSLFDPASVVVPPGTEIPFDIAVTVLKHDVPLEQALEGYYGSVKILGREELQIDGRRAVRMELVDEQPESASGSKVSYHYLIDLGNQILEASSYAVGEPPYARKKTVLDRMMRELRIARQ